MARWSFLVLSFLFAAGMMLDPPRAMPGAPNAVSYFIKPSVFQAMPSPLQRKKPRHKMADNGAPSVALMQSG